MDAVGVGYFFTASVKLSLPWRVLDRPGPRLSAARGVGQRLTARARFIFLRPSPRRLPRLPFASLAIGVGHRARIAIVSRLGRARLVTLFPSPFPLLP
jgi:hypothetical protein